MSRLVSASTATGVGRALRHPGLPPPVQVWRHPAIDAAAAQGPLGTVAYRYGKRAMDVAAAIAGLLATGWLWPLVALAVKLDSRGPVVFRQWRPGLRRRPFVLYKFRTMVDGAEGMLPEIEQMSRDPAGVLVDVPNDPRVTRVGRWLRKTSVDEWPQFINILKGEMSLVGPRPFARSFTIRDPRALQRFAVRPGLTGPWQISGRKDTTFAEAVEKDVVYVQQWSLPKDVSVIMRTMGVLLRAKGAR